VQETGDFELDGVTFPAAEIVLEFIDPADEGEGEGGGAMFPTGNLTDTLEVPGVGTLEVTMINAGIPTVFVNAADIGCTGIELQDAINGDAKALAMFETIRAHGAVRMGLIKDLADAAKRQHTPKVAFVAPPADYTNVSQPVVLTWTVENHSSEYLELGIWEGDPIAVASAEEVSWGGSTQPIGPCFISTGQSQMARDWFLSFGPPVDDAEEADPRPKSLIAASDIPGDAPSVRFIVATDGTVSIIPRAEPPADTELVVNLCREPQT
jgi:hypothetical protein